MALRTSVGSGRWSAAGTWATGVPVDGDTFLVAAGHVVDFDVDQSTFPNGVSGTITGTLRAYETAGTYYLKLAGPLTGAGTFAVGTSKAAPYPAACKFTIDMAAAGTVTFFNITLTVAIYCAEPTLVWAKTTSARTTADSYLDVDRDLTAEWKAGDTVAVVCPILSDAGIQQSTKVIASVTSTRVNLTTTLAHNSPAGSMVALMARNVVLTGHSGAYFTNHNGQTVYAECYGFARLASGGSSNPTTGMAITYGGSMRLVSYPSISTAGYVVVDGVLLYYAPVSSVSALIFKAGALVLGTNQGTYIYVNTVIIEPGARWFGCSTMGVAPKCVIGSGATVEGGRYFLSATGGVQLRDSVFSTAISTHPAFSRPAGWTSFYNCLVDHALELTWGSTPTENPDGAYVESYNHDQAAGAFRAWTPGGSVSSVVDVVPTGKVRSYKATMTNALRWTMMQVCITVPAGETLRVRAWLRSDYTDDHLPRVQVISPVDDPLTKPGATALAEAIAPAVADAWYEAGISYANTTDAPVEVILRCACKRASGNVWFYPEWGLGHVGRGWHGWS